MLRKTTCAVAGIVLACAAGYSLSVLAQSEVLSNLDLRWIQTSTKQDRLPTGVMVRDGNTVLAVDLPSQSTTIVTRAPIRPTMESAVRTPRPTSVRTTVHPVREVPNDEEEAKRERLPEGCEPAFSPVTMPAFAHIGVRCDS